MWLAFVAGNYTESHAHQEQGAFTLLQDDWLAVTENIWTHSGIQQGTETNNVIRFVRNGKPLPQHQPSRAVLTIDADDPSTGAIAATADLSPVYSAGSGVHAWKRSINFPDASSSCTIRFPSAMTCIQFFRSMCPGACRRRRRHTCRRVAGARP